LQGLGAAQPLVQLGFLDVTAPPFNADNTGVEDCTAALNAAVAFGRKAYLVVGLPPGRYRVNSTVNMVQPGKLFKTTVSGTPQWTSPTTDRATIRPLNLAPSATLPQRLRSNPQVGTPYCNNMAEVYGANVSVVEHCGRTAPAVMQGIPSAGKHGKNGSLSDEAGPFSRPRIVLSANSGLDGPVVLLSNPVNDNINMNQVGIGVSWSC
jgi:hypothetical protein